MRPIEMGQRYRGFWIYKDYDLWKFIHGDAVDETRGYNLGTFSAYNLEEAKDKIDEICEEYGEPES